MSKTHIDIKNKLKTGMIILLILSILVFLYELLKIDFLPSRYLVMTILVLTGLFAVVYPCQCNQLFSQIPLSKTYIKIRYGGALQISGLIKYLLENISLKPKKISILIIGKLIV